MVKGLRVKVPGMRRTSKIHGFNMSSYTVDCGVILEVTLPRPRLEAKGFQIQWIECMNHCGAEDHTHSASVRVQISYSIGVKNFPGTVNVLTTAAF